MIKGDDYSAAYQRFESGVGTFDDLFVCAAPVYDKIVSAAEANLSKEYSLKDLFLDQVHCRPEKILAVAKPKLEDNLMPMEEKIFRAILHFDRYLKNLEYWNRLLGEVEQEYKTGFVPELDICKAPRYTNKVKIGTLKRLENLEKAMADLNLDTGCLYSRENVESAVSRIDKAYKLKSTSHGQLYYPNDLEAALV